MKTLSNTEAEFKKSVAYKKACHVKQSTCFLQKIVAALCVNKITSKPEKEDWGPKRGTYHWGLGRRAYLPKKEPITENLRENSITGHPIENSITEEPREHQDPR